MLTHELFIEKYSKVLIKILGGIKANSTLSVCFIMPTYLLKRSIRKYSECYINNKSQKINSETGISNLSQYPSR